MPVRYVAKHDGKPISDKRHVIWRDAYDEMLAHASDHDRVLTMLWPVHLQPDAKKRLCEPEYTRWEYAYGYAIEKEE
jgi:hypothetical protein